MQIQEFEQRTGYYPATEEYKVIEEWYMNSKYDKDEFCRLYKNNIDNLAEKIRNDVDQRFYKYEANLKKIICLSNDRNVELISRLENEEEWRPYEIPDNVLQKEYEELKNTEGTRCLEIDEAKNLLYKQFGFAKEAIIIHSTVPVHEKNRHNRLRAVGFQEREPLYNATDWNYIRFDCGQMSWELYNDQLRPFYR